MIEIPQTAALAVDSGGELPGSMVEMPQDIVVPEVGFYVISFAKYNEDVCEIDFLDSNKAKRAIKSLKLIGTKIRSKADFQRHSVDRIPVRREGDYKRLYRGLSDDIDLKELKLPQDARIFYFDIEPEKTLYVVAITQNHLETRKNRR